MSDKEIAKDIIKARKDFSRNGNTIKPVELKGIELPPISNVEYKKILPQVNTVSSSAKQIHGTVKEIETVQAMIVGALLLGVAAIITAVKKLGAGGSGYGELEEAGTDYTTTEKNTGKMSEEGKKRLIAEEGGMRLESYPDSKGIWTIGVGHTGEVRGKKLGPGVTITNEEGMKLLDQDLKRAEDVVKRDVKVPLTQKWFDALVNFVFINGHLQGTKLLNAVNKQDWVTARNELSIESIHENRMKKWRDYVSQDMTAEGKIKQTGTSSVQTATGQKFGGYQLQNKDVKISKEMGEYLKQVGGEGTITSGIRGTGGATSHASGRKIDVGLGGQNEDKIIQTAVPFMKHPATVHVAFEGLGRKNDNSDSVRISKNIVQRICNQYPEINRRIQNGSLKIYHWGWSLGGPNHHATGPHLDILMDPSRLNKKPVDQVNLVNKNNQQAVNNSQKIAKADTKQSTKSNELNKTKDTNDKIALVGSLDQGNRVGSSIPTLLQDNRINQKVMNEIV